MKRGLRGALAVALLIILSAALSASARIPEGVTSGAMPEEETIHVLVKVPSGIEPAEFAKQMESRPQLSKGSGSLSRRERTPPIKVKRVLHGSGWVAVEMPVSEAGRLSRQGYSVKESKIVHALLTDSVPLVNATLVWGLYNNTLGNITGKNVTIAIIDTGIDYTHPDLGNCTQAQHLAGNCKVLPGWDYVNNDSDSMDDEGHGTHVAGIAAANGSAKGVAPDATIVAYKALDGNGDGHDYDIIAAIENASAAGYDIISLSLGGPGDANDVMSQAVDDAVNAGAIVVVAAGNSGSSASTILSPGTARLALTVGNTDKNDVLNSLSSRGPNPNTLEIKPEITAPGVDISSTALGGGNTSLTGTSMSAPHVSGAAALIKQLHPGWTPSQVKAALVGTAKDLGMNVTLQGAGRLDALAAVNASFISEPSVLNIRSLFNTLGNASTYFNITDLSGNVYNVSLSVSLRESAGGSVNASLNASLVQVPGLGSAGVELHLTGLASTTSGTYSGIITANSSETTLSIPFWVRFNDCGVVSSSTTLTTNLSASAGCLYVDGPNLVLDGNGYVINGSGSGNGIDNGGGYANITIRNFAGIDNFKYGVYGDSMASATLFNNSISTANTSSSNGIYITGSSGQNITSNVIVSSGSGGNGIYLDGGAGGAVVMSNTVTTTGLDNWGILLQELSDSVISGNAINTTGSNGDAIYLLDLSNVTVSSNRMRTTGPSASGAVLDGVSGGALLANIILTSGLLASGVHLDSSAGNNTLSGDAVNATNAAEIYGEDGSNGNRLTNVLLLGAVNLTSHSLSGVSLDVNTTPPADPAGKHNISDYLTIANTSASSFIDFNLSYTDDEVSAFPESTLLMHRHNGSAWAALGTSSLDTTGNTVRSGNATAFGTFAPLGDSPAACGVISASATLAGNLTSNGTCFIINASNVVLDGNGYAITGEGSGKGIFADVNSNHTNLTIKNFAGIDNFSTAIDVATLFNSTVLNNTIRAANQSDSGGIFIFGSEGINITANTISLSGSGGFGINLEVGTANRVDANTVTHTGVGSYGIILWMQWSPSAVSNILTLSGSGATGILVQEEETAGTNLMLAENTLTVTGQQAVGISLMYSNGSNITENTVTTSGSEGYAFLLNLSDSNEVSSNTLLTNGSGAYAIYLVSSQNNTFDRDGINASSAPEIVSEGTSADNSITSALLMGATNLTSHSFSGVSIDVNTTPPAGPAGKRNLSDYVTIANTSASSFIDFNLSYTSAEAADVDASSLRIHRHDGGSWQELASSDVDAAGITVRSGNVTSFGTFAAFGNDSLPQWSSAWNGTPATFNASALLRFNITWTDNTEVSSVAFEVNRSGTVLSYNGSNTSASAWNLTLADFPAGTHYWRSTALDIMGSSNTSPWFAFTIARESPSLSLTLNGSAGDIAIDENSSVWLNASVSQGDSAYTLEIAVDGSSKGKNASGPHANLTIFSTAGRYNVSANYTETQNYSAALVSYFLTVNDTLPPEVLSHSPTGTIATSSATLSAATNENSTCRFSASSGVAYENMSGEMSGNATNHTASLSELADGTHHRYIRCNNTNGRVATADYDATFAVSITVTPSSGGGGGGGGAAVESSSAKVPSATRVFSVVTPAEAVSASISKEGMPVTGIELAVTSLASNVQLTVAAHSTLPEDAPVAPRSSSGAALAVYSYLDVSHTNLEGKLREAWLTFRVNRSWLTENDVAKGDIVLMRYTPRGWDELSTSISDESLGHVTYTARTPSFSVFAIAVRQQALTAPAGTEENATLPQEGGEPTGEVVSYARGEEGTSGRGTLSALISRVQWKHAAWLAAVALVAFIALSFLGKHGKRAAPGAAKAPPGPGKPAPDLRIYISKSRREGRSEEEIRGELLKAGWSAEAIDGAFGSRRSLEPRRDPSLLLYIQGCRRKGFSDDDIRRALISGGWDEDIILYALKAAPRARKAGSDGARRRE